MWEEVINGAGEATTLDLAPTPSAIRTTGHQVVTYTSETHGAQLGATTLADAALRAEDRIVANHPHCLQDMENDIEEPTKASPNGPSNELQRSPHITCHRMQHMPCSTRSAPQHIHRPTRCSSHGGSDRLCLIPKPDDGSFNQVRHKLHNLARDVG